jgi:signal peptidase II
MINRFWKMCLLMSAIIIGDQLSKVAVQSSFYLGESIPMIDGLFNFTYVRNTGAAFGMGAGVPEFWRVTFFLVIPVIICGAIFYMLIKSLKGPLHLTLSYSLILAGAIGNLIDRFSLGYVVDFFDFYWGTNHFPAFNIADSAITVAAFLLIYDALIYQPRLTKLNNSKSTN